MRAFASSQKGAAVGVKAFYSIPELARIGRITRFTMTRLLVGSGVTFVRSGRTLMVPLSEIRSRAPAVWNSLVTLEKLHVAATAEGRAAASGDTDDDRD